ncbi:FAD-dependent monooxygenase [Nonomuraea typhae]|uniref:FAD-dependent monooxygenase n=1 Tax=Nonomuraea typhae TaxID=2603600 RepID=UPI0012F9974C|nr:FAD-dependent monooxygenase [Nonomuraea typhae]
MEERTAVLIVGAGYAGLSAATMLAWHQVPVILVERHASTSIQPKAFGVGPRVLELMRGVPGIESEFSGIWAGIGEGMRIAIASSLTDPDPKILVDTAGDLDSFVDITPVPDVGAPQSEIERVLRGKAEEFGADLRFSTELVFLEQDADGVTARVRTKAGEHTIRADHLIAADGHRSPLRAALGVPTSGKGELQHMYSIMFDADLSQVVRDREVTLWYLQADGLTGAIITGTGVGAHGLGVYYDPATAPGFTTERCIDLVRQAVGVPDLDVSVLDTTTFTIAHQLADTYRAGRVFFAGDAAHTMPPTGGQGGSTALQDGCDLAWRLWLVHSGQAGPAFLDTYDAERRPIGALTANEQLANMAVRMPSEQTRDVAPPTADPMAVMLGYRYHSTSILNEPTDDGSLLENPQTATARPGSRAPHVLLDWEGMPISTIDLFGTGHVLLIGPRGRDWETAARAVSDRLDLHLTPLVIGGDLKDLEGVWQERYGVTETGAVLVRPDGYVSWRAPALTPSPKDTLNEVLTTTLSRTP